MASKPSSQSEAFWNIVNEHSSRCLTVLCLFILKYIWFIFLFNMPAILEAGNGAQRHIGLRYWCKGAPQVGFTPARYSVIQFDNGAIVNPFSWYNLCSFVLYVLWNFSWNFCLHCSQLELGNIQLIRES